MEYFLQQLINGLTLGSIYGLIAIGYTMVYGIIGMINFAHGDVFMIGGFVSLIAIVSLGLTGGSGLFLIILGLRRRDLGFRRGRSAYRRDSERRGDCWSSGYRRRSWSASFSRRSQLGRVRRAPLRR